MPALPIIAGRYRLLELIGEGGSGRVYRAMDEVEPREVAVKLIQAAQGQNAQRVDREVSALRHLRIPGVVRLFDVGREGDDSFIVMELIDGAPFPGTAGALNWPELAPLVVRLLETLARVHGAGILHRDLKPGNVLVTPDGHVVLVDFGLARGTPLGQTFTGTMEFLGTFRYVAPEQLESGRVDQRSDIYAVGLMVYEALAGRPALLEGTGGASIQRRITREITPIRSLLPDLAPEVYTFIDRLVRRLPEDRPQTAGEALRLLLGERAANPSGPGLPRLGSVLPLERLVGELRAGRSVDLGGAPGAGRSRLLVDAAQQLAADGVRVHWVAPGELPFQSVHHLVGRPSGAIDPITEMSERLEAMLHDGVLFVDDHAEVDRASRTLIDRLRRRLPVVRVVDGADDLRLPPLTELDLRGLFHGPDRVLHLREDAARELFLRTSGLPRHITRELAAWTASGIVRWDGGLLRVTREALDQLAEGIRGGSALPEEKAATIDRRQRDLLAWVAVAGQAASVAVLAAAAEQPAWEIRLELEALADAGAVALHDDGTVRLLAGTGDLVSWSEERRQLAHLAVARQLSPGTEGRLGHLMEGRDQAAARDECEVLGALAAERGVPGRAFSLFQIGLDLSRTLELDEAPMLIGMLSVASELDNLRYLDALEYEVRRSRPSAAASQVAVLVGALQAAGRGEFAAAEARTNAMGPLPDWRLEAARMSLLVRICLLKRPADAGDLLVAIEPATREVSLLNARWHGWVGHHFRNQGRYLEAAAWHQRAAAGVGGARYQLSGAYNAAVCSMDGLDFEAARTHALELRRAARAASAPSFELRAETLLRDRLLRLGEQTEVDMELVMMCDLVASPVDYIVYFQEGLIARSLGMDALATELARRCYAVGVKRRHRMARMAGEVLARACGGSPEMADEQIAADLRALPTARLRVQFQTLYACTLPPDEAMPWLLSVAEDHASVPAAIRGRRLEVSSVDEALVRLRAHVLVHSV